MEQPLSPTREQAVEALRAHLTAELEALERMNAMTVDEVTSDESKAENKYDTRGLEASYLARGQADRLVALRRQVGWLASVPRVATEQVGLGSLVGLDEDGSERWLFVVPEGGGSKVDVGGVSVHTVSPRSPLGRALVGCEAGDELEIEGERVIEVVDVR